MVQIVNITNAARARMLNIIKSDKCIGLRLSLTTYGCSGKAYDMQLIQEAVLGDEVVSFLQNEEGLNVDKVNNAILFVDQRVVMFIIGITIDYKESDIESSFVFENPNAKHGCGCGKSFLF
jgi:iron-sulfur cluster assembly protein